MSNLIVHNALNDFLNNFESSHTKAAYRKDIKDFANFLADNGKVIADPKHITVTDLVSYKNFLTDNFASKTSARKLASIKSMLNWFYALNLIPVNPGAHLKMPKANVKTPTNAFTDEEVHQVLEASAPTNFYRNNHQFMFHLLFYMGLRRSELVNIKLGDIIQVNHELVVRIVGKGNKLRELPMPEEVVSAFFDFLENRKKYTNLILGAEDWIFQSSPIHKNLGSIHPGSVFNFLKKYLQELGITRKLSPHSCRATAITKAIEAGAILTEVADMAGHSNISTTQIYWKRREGFKNAASKKIKYS